MTMNIQAQDTSSSDATPLALYESIRNASSDWKTELALAEKELARQLASGRAKKNAHHQMIVQVDEAAQIELRAELNRRHGAAYQMFVFAHDGALPKVALVNLVPPKKDAATKRRLITGEEFAQFYADVVDDMLAARCAETLAEAARLSGASVDTLAASFTKTFTAKQLGYDVRLVKEQIEKVRFGKQSEAGRRVLESVQSGRFTLTVERERGATVVLISAHSLAPK